MRNPQKNGEFGAAGPWCETGLVLAYLGWRGAGTRKFSPPAQAVGEKHLSEWRRHSVENDSLLTRSF
jgi:hypothetical protein